MTVEEQIEVYKSKIRELRKLKENFSESNSEKDSDKIVQNAADIVSRKQATWRYLFKNDQVVWSEHLYSIFEISEDLKGEELLQAYFSTLNENDRELISSKIESIKLGQTDDYYLTHPILKNGTIIKWVACSGFALRKNGNVIGISGTVEKISEKYGDSESLNQFFEISIDLHCIANDEGYFLKISPSWSKLLGYSDAELCSQPFVNFVHPDDRIQTVYETNELAESRPVSRFQNRYITKDGKVVYLNWSSKRDPVSGLFFSTARNVTNEEHLKQSLNNEIKNKDMLLREIHHRVKNNLQIISSLLSLQAKVNYTKKNVNQLLLESQSRVKAMASIHEHFYQSHDIARLNVKSYITKLVNDLIYAYFGNKSSINLEIKIDDCHLDLDEAVPLGLIINELVGNALKHAFDDGEESKLFVSLDKTGNAFKIIIGDNGKGYKINFDNEMTDSIGLIIVDGLIEQLGGQFSQIEKEKGTWVEIRF